jgi:hypothetical protein
MREWNEPNLPPPESEFLEQVIALEAPQARLSLLFPASLERPEARRSEPPRGLGQVEAPVGVGLGSLPAADATEPVEFLNILGRQPLDVGIANGEPVERYGVPGIAWARGCGSSIRPRS